MGVCESSTKGCERGFVDGLVFMPPRRNLDPHRRHFSTLSGSDGRLAFKLFKPLFPTLIMPPSLGATKSLIIFAHGNACDLFDMDLQPLANALHVPILAFDYPGYGESEGTPSEASACRALAAMVAYAQWELGYTTSKIFLCGQSLGTGVVTHHAYVHRDSWTTPIILISPFRSIVKVVSRSLGPLACLASPLDRFQSETKFKHLKCPVKIYHGLEDTIIPPDHSRKLLEALPAPLRLPPTWMPGIGHNGILEAIPFGTLRAVLDAPPLS